MQNVLTHIPKSSLIGTKEENTLEKFKTYKCVVYSQTLDLYWSEGSWVEEKDASVELFPHLYNETKEVINKNIIYQILKKR